MKTLGRILAPLTLLEWGGILIYFYYSGRIAAFLHPLFRPLVLATGILLVLTAVCVAIFQEDDCSHTSHDHDHEPDFAEDEQDQHTHSHGSLSVRRFLAFLILLLPLALAAKISPDSYGANLINNRGLVEDVRGLPRNLEPARQIWPEESLPVVSSAVRFAVAGRTRRSVTQIN